MHKPPKILILEDEIEFGVRLCLDLEAEGFDVIRHTTATRALNYVEKNPVDLIIADLLIRVAGTLQADGGVKLISALKQIRNDPVPIIAMSSLFSATFGSNEARTTAATVGASSILAKPFEMKDLLAEIDRLLPDQDPAEVRLTSNAQS